MEGNEVRYICERRDLTSPSHPIQNLISFCVPHTHACMTVSFVALVKHGIVFGSPQLYYWPINFRGHFIQALLRYAGVNYELAPVYELPG